MKTFFLLCFFSLSFLVFAHEGHQHHEAAEWVQSASNESVRTWLKGIGSFHLILLHFPIALINMLAVSEFLLGWLKKPIYDFSSRFLVVSGAILSPITAVLGLILSYSGSYEGKMETFLLWHMWLGILTAILIVFIAFIRFHWERSMLYFLCLILVLLLVNLTGFFGGEMTFGSMMSELFYNSVKMNEIF